MKITFAGNEIDNAFEVMKANLKGKGYSETSVDATVRGAMRGILQCMGATLSPEKQEFYLNMILNWGKPDHHKTTEA